eukprot:TRINITY_DN741_c0_g1_i2.p1 TRINITY_DN741_c0_g1~~TRINITY_DN741_c0_g1_i2.p1  ORF type:complete len:425 (-),score=88.85 TRINITY_DN741_c0_g1_i2:21-1295(-)
MKCSLLLVVFLFSCLVVSEDCYQVVKLDHPQPMDYAHYGQAVSISRGFAVVGAYAQGPSESGAAYVFSKDKDWELISVLVSKDNTTTNNNFGWDVTNSDEWIAIGAPGENAVYIFRPDGTDWTFHQVLKGPTGSLFGTSVRLRGITLVVGSPASNSITIFELREGQWNQFQNIDSTTFSFGSKLSFFSSNMVVGAPSNNSAIEFNLQDEWNFIGEIKPIGQITTDILNYGDSVFVDSDLAFIAAFREPTAGKDAGALYVYRKTNGKFIQIDRIVPESLRNFAHFGESVTRDSSGNVYVSAHRLNFDEKTESGVVYQFDSRLKLISEISPKDPTAFKWFGRSLDMESELILIGANQDSTLGPQVGSAYIFNCPAGNNGNFDENMRDTKTVLITVLPILAILILILIGVVIYMKLLKKRKWWKLRT